MSKYHFTATKEYAQRVAEYRKQRNIFNVGALSLDNLKKLKLLTTKSFIVYYNINIALQLCL